LLARSAVIVALGGGAIGLVLMFLRLAHLVRAAGAPDPK